MQKNKEIFGVGSFFKILEAGEFYDPDLEKHHMRAPFFEYLLRLELGAQRYFDSSLSMSLSRAFGFYQRIMELEGEEDPHRGRPSMSLFLDADIESFIIRHRIILNDLASILRHLYPAGIRGMPSPRGAVDPSDRETSIWELEKFCAKNPGFHPGLLEILERNRRWLHDVRSQRDRIIHYKAKVMVISYEDGRLEFIVHSPSWAGLQTISENGVERIVGVPVFSFVHDQMESLWRFMNGDLVAAMREYAVKNQLPVVPSLGVHGFSAYGVELFKSNRARSLDEAREPFRRN
jgi:hypothetical protein